MSVDVGDVYSTSITVDVDGAPADATTVTCTVTYPDGTTGDPHVDHYGTGLYRTGVPALMPGLHVIDWQATGLHESAYRDSFTATDPAMVPALSLRQVKAHLNITSQDQDEELRTVIADVASIAEANSASENCRPPSPASTTTGLSGRPTLAPIPAGNPYPSVP